MAAFNQYLGERKTYLLNTKGKENIGLVELERLEKEIEGKTVGQVNEYFTHRMDYLLNTKGKQNIALVELEKAEKQLQGAE